MIEEIKIIYQKVDNKSGFIERLAIEFNKSARGIQNNWFSSLYSVPVKYQSKVLELLKQTIQNQIKDLEKILE